MKLLVFICSPFAPFLDGSMGRALYLNNRYKSVEFLKLHIYDEYFVFVSDFRCSHFMCGASQKHKFYGMVNKNDVSIQRFWLQCRDRILALSILWLRHISDEVLISAQFHSDTNASTHFEPVPWISYYGPGMFFKAFGSILSKSTQQEKMHSELGVIFLRRWAEMRIGILIFKSLLHSLLRTVCVCEETTLFYGFKIVLH